ncbi:MAG: hypothetical protein ACRCU0_05270 [Candidatus Rhabdochlamydia sp.]
MTWPTDLARQSTNPFSPEAMARKNFMEEVLRKNREKKEQRFDRDSSTNSSGSSKGSNALYSSTFADKKDNLFADFSRSQQSPTTSSSSSSGSQNAKRKFEVFANSGSNFNGRVASSIAKTNASKEKNCSLM